MTGDPVTLMTQQGTLVLMKKNIISPDIQDSNIENWKMRQGITCYK